MSKHDTLPHDTPWLKVPAAAKYANTGEKLIYREIKAGRLLAARIGNRRDIRTRREWLDEWLIATTQPREIRRAG